MKPITEFRTMNVNSPEPADRTSAGNVVGEGNVLDLGSVDTTDEARDTRVMAVWWRVCDMNGAQEIKNVRVCFAGADELAGNNSWYIDITDTWTPGKTPVQVKAGSPGNAPLDEPGTELNRIGGGNISGITHDHTSKYIYIAANVAINEPVGVKDGLRLVVRFDYR